jgi:hypothetical protein
MIAGTGHWPKGGNMSQILVLRRLSTTVRPTGAPDSNLHIERDATMPDKNRDRLWSRILRPSYHPGVWGDPL